MLPNALFVGPTKTGTTWIHRYLKHRGDVVLPRGVKETSFFDVYYDRGLKWYSALFRDDPSAKRVVEVGPGYFHKTEVAERILEDLGKIPVVCSLRDPLTRAFSAYLDGYRRSRIPPTFREAAIRVPGILQGSCYATHLQRWYDVFGAENVLVVFHETLTQNPDAFVRPICQHLELPFIPVPDSLKVRLNEASLPASHLLASFGCRVASLLRRLRLQMLVDTAAGFGLRRVFFGRPGARPLPVFADEDQAWFVEQIAGEIEQLETMLGIDLAHWKLD